MSPIWLTVYSQKGWKPCFKRSSPIQLIGNLLGFSSWEEGLTPQAHNIAAKSVAVRTCAKERLMIVIYLVDFSWLWVTGEELDAFLKRQAVEYDRIIYVGDGSNDFCPILRLRRCVSWICTKKKSWKRRGKKSAKIWCFAGHIADSKNALKETQKPRLWNVPFAIGQAPGKSKRCLTNYKTSIHHRSTDI